MKTVVIMQPYFFPYLGYFQLAAAASVFVTLDDVSFIKGGWINRNRFLVQNRAHMFTVPVKSASSNRLINATQIAGDDIWKKSFIRLLNESYAHAPYYRETIALVNRVIHKAHASIGDLADDSVRTTCAHIGLEKKWLKSRDTCLADSLKGTARILEICQSLGANRYVNAPGGKELYRHKQFAQLGIELRFLKPFLPPYRQQSGEFVGGLSIVDVLMYNPRDLVRNWIEGYELE